MEVIEKRLMRGGFLLRYDEADDFGTPENAFLVCTFWYIDALASVGRKDEARELFANVLVAGATMSACSPRTSTRRPASSGAISRRPIRRSA